MKLGSTFFKMTMSLAISITSLSSFGAQDYCIAMRGNGELIPAHWGALAKVIETYGEPSKAAGGSSASISVFLLESLKMNPFLSSDPKVRAENMALLLKSFPEYLSFLGKTSPEGKIINYWFKDPQFQGKLTDFMEALKKDDPIAKKQTLVSFAKKHYDEFLALFENNENSLQLSGPESLLPYINPKYRVMLKETIKIGGQSSIFDSREEKQKALAQIKFRYEQAIQSIKLLGAFNAETDSQLFFRPGVVNFEKIAWRFAHMADAYAGVKASAKTAETLRNFLNTCRAVSVGKSWTDIKTANPECRNQFYTWMNFAYLDLNSPGIGQDKWSRNPSRWNDKVGQYMDVFPVTSIVENQSAKNFLAKQIEYKDSFDPQFGLDFKVAAQDLSIGYWGRPASLSGIETKLKELYPNDLKSSMFKKLGSVTWREVLMSSPAEPGLSVPVPLQQTSKNLKNKVLSFGGWPDLHPVLVLKASGCENVVYITRQGGDSIFGQGVFKRLTDLDGFDWAKITPEVNDRGIPEDTTSNWGRFYNLANPNSSFNMALRQASVVYCTNWNILNLKDGPGLMSDHGYSEGKIYNMSEKNSYTRSEETAGCL